jgi:hypothetical protein
VVETGSVDLDVTVRNIGGLGATGTEQSVSQINDRDRGVKTGIQNPAYRHIAHF